MNYRITAPAAVRTTIGLPASKSISNRALILNALCENRGTVRQLADCDDTRVLKQALACLPDSIDIEGAGTAMRFLTAYLSIREGDHRLTGNRRMQERPVGPLVEALRQLGADIGYENRAGYPPLRIRGRQLDGKQPVRIAGNISSQYISALLLIGPYINHGLTLHLEGTVTSRPYIDMTCRLMKRYGQEVHWNGPQQIIVPPGRYHAADLTVEADWSAASYWYAIAALSADAEIGLIGLEKESCQGDSRVAGLFENLGVKTVYTENGVMLRKSGERTSELHTDFSDIPDLAQTLAVCACLLGIPFRFEGLESLYIKETDRMAALQEELGKLGFHTTEPEKGVLAWNGKRNKSQTAPVIQTYGDHRMAMAFAPAALCTDGLVIEHPEVVSKSYPAFWNDLSKAGFCLEECDDSLK